MKHHLKRILKRKYSVKTNKIIIKECKLCNQVQPAYYDGLFGDGKTKKFVNADGQQWNGRICPTCQVECARLNMREKRKRNREVR